MALSHGHGQVMIRVRQMLLTAEAVLAMVSGLAPLFTEAASSSSLMLGAPRVSAWRGLNCLPGLHETSPWPAVYPNVSSMHAQG